MPKMKTLRRSVCALCAVLILLPCVCLPARAAASAYYLTPEEWQTCLDKDITKMMINPGSDATELNFVWHSKNYISFQPILQISDSPDMRDASSFDGAASASDVKGYVVNRVTARALEPDTVYYYRYKTSGGYSDICETRTGDPSSFSFLFISDMQPNEDADIAAESLLFNNTMASALSYRPDVDFIVSGGDQTQHGDSSYEWSAVMASPILRSYAFATVVGNHDNKGTSYGYYVNEPNSDPRPSTSLAGRSWWFRYGSVLFLMLNSNNADIASQYGFISSAVSANKDAKWRVAVFHHDIYGTGRHTQSTDNTALASMLAPLMDMFGVDLVLNGHEHIYGRSYYMKDNKVVTNAGYDDGSVTDPVGTLYLTASSCAGKNRSDEASKALTLPWNAMRVFSDDPLYSVVGVDDGVLSINTYDSVSNEQEDSFTITKTGLPSAGNGSFITYLLNGLSILLANCQFFVKIINDLRSK